MSAEVLRRAASLMRERAEAATDGGFGWHVTDLPGGNEVWAKRDAAGWDAFMVATTATRLNPNPGERGYADAAHIASWHPAVAVAVADWLDDQGREYDANEAIWRVSSLDPENRWAERGLTVEANLSHHHGHALAVARAYLGESA